MNIPVNQCLSCGSIWAEGTMEFEYIPETDIYLCSECAAFELQDQYPEHTGEVTMTTETKYPQRADYMAKKVTHAEFYESVAAVAGISYANSDMLPRIKEALAAGDEHLNTIPLKEWDVRAAFSQHHIARSLKLHGDFYSMAGGVSTHKAAAKKAAREAV